MEDSVKIVGNPMTPEEYMKKAGIDMSAKRTFGHIWKYKLGVEYRLGFSKMEFQEKEFNDGRGVRDMMHLYIDFYNGTRPDSDKIEEQTIWSTGSQDARMKILGFYNQGILFNSVFRIRAREVTKILEEDRQIKYIEYFIMHDGPKPQKK